MKIIAWVVFLAFSAQAETLTLNTAHTFPRSTPDNRGYEDLILIEAFRQMGYQIRITHLPSERALMNADSGVDDGNYARVKGLEKKYPNLVCVPESITQFDFAVFTKNAIIKIQDWSSLKPYSIGLVTGWKILEENIVETRSLTAVKEPEDLFLLLQEDRAELVVFDKTQGEAILNKMKIKGVKVLSPYLAQQEMFVYLNKKHENLVPLLDKTLKKMKKNGMFQKFINSIGD